MTRNYDSPSLSTNPFESVFYHLGMPLRVPEFEDEQAYHRGKHWLHDAWLHGAGVVWGLSLDVLAEQQELRVNPGLAYDARGREVFLERQYCVSFADFVEQHAAEIATIERTDRDAEAPKVFDAHVVLSFATARERPTPIVGSDELSPGRIRETARAELRLGRAPEEEQPKTFENVRALFHAIHATDGAWHHATDGEPENLDDPNWWHRRIRSAPSWTERSRLYRKALRQLASLDTRKATPPGYDPAHGPAQAAAKLYPGLEPTVVLAELRGVSRQPSGLKSGKVSATRRPALLSGALLQTLLCETMAATVPPKDAGGPRVGHAVVHPHRIVLDFDKRLAPSSVSKHGFSVSVLREGGWTPVPIEMIRPAELAHFEIDAGTRVEHSVFVTLSGGEILVRDVRRVREEIVNIEVVDYKSLTLELGQRLEGQLVRIIAKGTGSTPLLGENHVPLAGGRNDGPGTRVNGNDFVFQWPLHR